MTLVAEWITSYNLITKKTEKVNNIAINNYIDKNFQELKKNTILQNFEYSPIVNALDKLKLNFINYIQSYPVPMVSEHGDLSPANVLIN